jgi:diguanylate cyclase (GGDEF)-like protein
MSFGRRLALFFVLIVLVPMLALVGVLVLVSEDSRQGKADARLAAGLETALALYAERVTDATPAAKELAGAPALGSGLRSGDSAELEEFARDAAEDPRVAGVEVLGPAGTLEAEAGGPDAIAFAKLDLADLGAQRGALRVSVTTAAEFASELKRLTNRELVVTRSGIPLAATVEPAAVELDPGETGDVELPEGDFRAHLLSLDEDSDEFLLMLGPRPEEGLLAIERPALALLAAFLLLAGVLAYVLARTLTGLHSRVAEQAITDPLTGLSNRRRLDELLDREVERSLRFGHELAVLIVDVDDFKRINDDYGHQVGDEVLETVADRARSTARSIDVSARYGGDELALILIETGTGGAQILADRLRDKVRESEIYSHDGGRLTVTISVGFATLRDCASDPESLIDAADQALLVAKRAGKDQTRKAPRTPRRKLDGIGSASVRNTGRRDRGGRAAG